MRTRFNLLLLEFALSALWRRKIQSMGTLVVFSALVFLLSSVLFISDGIKKELDASLYSLPQITLQRIRAGKQSDIDVFIEGHTDNKPINTVQFKDNWDLSVIRATSVVRILTKDYNVSSLQIQPSGRGEYMPVASNESADGRSKNRRTEIIMAPKLDKLLELLQ